MTSVRNIMSRAECMLISARGLDWEKVFLAMFAVYVDDSGTDPNQKVAIASAIIIPAKQIPAMEREWEKFKVKETFCHFHTSEFVSRNPKSEFANWDDIKQQRVFDRVLQITRKYGVQGYSFAVNKDDYDETVNGEWRALFGKNHYTWALRHALGCADEWRIKRNQPPLEFVFSWMGKSSDPKRREVEEMMDLTEDLALEDGKDQGQYTNYNFRHSKDFAGLQCVDMIGWVSYQIGLRTFKITSLPAHKFVKQAEADFASNRRWILLFTVTRDNLTEWFHKEQNTESSQRFIRQWRERESRIAMAGRHK